MVLKYVVIHSYSSLSTKFLKQSAEHWSDSEKNDFERKLEKDMDTDVASMRSFGLWDFASKKERDFLSSSGSQISSTSQLNGQWRMEAATILMWALKFIDTFPETDVQSSPELLKQVEVRRLGLLSPRPSLRSHDEISKMRDIIELWHWRVNTSRLVKDNFDFKPAESLKSAGINTLDDIITMTARSAYSKGEISNVIDDDLAFRGQAFRNLGESDFNEAASIIIERHYALNWLCGFAPKNNWDETPTDT